MEMQHVSCEVGTDLQEIRALKSQPLTVKRMKVQRSVSCESNFLFHDFIEMQDPF
jgi:hypothetical protein